MKQRYAHTNNYTRVLAELSSIITFMSDEEIEKAMFILWAEQQSRIEEGEKE